MLRADGVRCRGSGRSRRCLAWRVTGFTIGHSVTLALGFFGHVPTGTWFIPLVETGIALSIVYAAAVSLIAVGHRMTTLVTAHPVSVDAPRPIALRNPELPGRQGPPRRRDTDARPA